MFNFLYSISEIWVARLLWLEAPTPEVRLARLQKPKLMKPNINRSCYLPVDPAICDVEIRVVIHTCHLGAARVLVLQKTRTHPHPVLELGPEGRCPLLT